MIVFRITINLFCKASLSFKVIFLAELNRTPWDELLKCKLPILPNPDIKELEFTPIERERIKEIDQLIYRGRQTWEQAWPDREKNYQLGYFRLAEAFFDANNDGKKDHVIRKLLPAQSCRPLNRDEGGNVVSVLKQRTKQWESMTKQQQIQQAQMIARLKKATSTQSTPRTSLGGGAVCASNTGGKNSMSLVFTINLLIIRSLFWAFLIVRLCCLAGLLNVHKYLLILVSVYEDPVQRYGRCLVPGYDQRL